MWIYIATILLFLFLYKSYLEPLTNLSDTKTITNIATCQNCKMYNHRDARSKCDGLCSSKYPKSTYTGVWTKIKDGSSCECAYDGKLSTAFVDTPFLWNNTEAKSKCAGVCMNAFKGKSPNATGNWKNVSANGSACECTYYK